MEGEMEINTMESNPIAPNPSDPSVAATQKKHASMLEHLSARHNQSSTSRRAESSSIQTFLNRFSEEKHSIESKIEFYRSKIGAPKSGPHLKTDLEKVSSSIADLEKLLAESSYLLPPYEVRTALKSISDLKEGLEKASSELLPKKRFSFRNKPTKKEACSLVHKVVEDIQDLDVVPGGRFDLSLAVQDSPGFRNREGTVLVKDFRGSEQGEGDFSLSDLNSCEVYLRGRFIALFVHRLRNCRVFIGPVLGSVLIEDVEGCLFMLASHQIRIHQARESDFYLRVRSRPIVEDCNGVRFGPYQLFYEGIVEDLRASGLEEETNNWAKVDDFRWLRAVPSPNWRVLAVEECEGTTDISDLNETG